MTFHAFCATRLAATLGIASLLGACASGIDLFERQGAEIETVTVGMAGTPPVAAMAPRVRVGRYTSVLSEPTVSEVQPLQSVIQITFPRDGVRTEQALDYTLLRSGYRLGSATTPAQSQFRQLPLPESQRALGPYTVERVLQTLIGSEWQLTADHPARVVSFEEFAPGQGAPLPLVPLPSTDIVDTNGRVIAPYGPDAARR